MKQVAEFFAAPLLRKKRNNTPPPDSRFVKKRGRKKKGLERKGPGKDRARKGRLLASMAARGFPFPCIAARKNFGAGGNSSTAIFAGNGNQDFESNLGVDSRL